MGYFFLYLHFSLLTHGAFSQRNSCAISVVRTKTHRSQGSLPAHHVCLPRYLSLLLCTDLGQTKCLVFFPEGFRIQMSKGNQSCTLTPYCHQQPLLVSLPQSERGCRLSAHPTGLLCLEFVVPVASKALECLKHFVLKSSYLVRSRSIHLLQLLYPSRKRKTLIAF